MCVVLPAGRGRVGGTGLSVKTSPAEVYSDEVVQEPSLTATQRNTGEAKR